MTRGMLDLLRALAASVAEDEAAADHLLEMVERIADESAPQATAMRTLARMHRAKAIANRAKYDALAVEYARRADGLS